MHKGAFTRVAGGKGGVGKRNADRHDRYPSFFVKDSMSSERGANSFLSIKLNSWTK